MFRKALLIATTLVFAAGWGPARADQPYAGQQHRQVKALSEEQISDLRAGRGMGLALAAELNGYPGPVHVLELANQLSLTPEQRSRMNELYDAMRAEAIPIGERLLALEAALDSEFAERTVTPDSLAAAVDEIAETQGALRLTHLKYHLSTVELLDAAQIARYMELRGYHRAESGRHHPPSKNHKRHQ